MKEKEFNNFKNNILQLAEETIKEHPHLKKGQVVFNVIYEMFPDIGNNIRASEIDPSHNDDNIDCFFNYLKKKLYNKEK